MYCNFYGISEKPFEVTPDPRFLYRTASCKEILASLVYGINERRGFISVVGEVGTGKTTLLNAALDKLDPHTKTAVIFNTDLTFKQMLLMALTDLGLVGIGSNLTKAEAIQRLNAFAIEELSQGGNVVLIVDEAQNLNFKCLENLRLLSNLETRRYKLVQIILSGQPELNHKLNQPELRQLSQRISLKRYVTPLSRKETEEYIQHRLAVVNCGDANLFSKAAKELIWSYSQGIPRKINILCDNALLIGFGLGRKKIRPKIVAEAIADLTFVPDSVVGRKDESVPARQ